MKIIKKDNFDRESVSDVLIAENVDVQWADMIVEALNNKLSGMYAEAFFAVKPDNYELYKYDPT